MSGVQKVITPQGRKLINETSGVAYWDSSIYANFSDFYASINGSTLSSPIDVILVGDSGHIFDASQNYINLYYINLIGHQLAATQNNVPITITGDFTSKQSNSYFKYQKNISWIQDASTTVIPFRLTNSGADRYDYATLDGCKLTQSQAVSVISVFGDEIFIMNGDRSGERAFITAITNPGEATEQWSISPALSGTFASTMDLKIIKVKKCEEKTIDISRINEPIKFICNGFRSDKLFIEVVVKGIADSFPISISEMKIYGK